MVVGVDVAAQRLRGQGSDDLVGVHVGGGPGAGLEDVHGEVSVVLSGGHGIGGGDDSLRNIRVQHAQLGVGSSGGLLHPRQCLDVAALQRDARDGEVLHRALGLGSVQSGGGHADLAHGVAFNAELGHEAIVSGRRRVRRAPAVPRVRSAHTRATGPRLISVAGHWRPPLRERAWRAGLGSRTRRTRTPRALWRLPSLPIRWWPSPQAKMCACASCSPHGRTSPWA